MFFLIFINQRYFCDNKKEQIVIKMFEIKLLYTP
jgi:hypothetical protein